MIGVLSDNKVLMTFYDYLSRSPQQDSSLKLGMLLRDKIHERQELMIDVDSDTKKLDNLFRANDLRYLLPKFTFFHREQHDIDVLVSAADFGEVVKMLQSERYKVTSVQSAWKVTLAKWVEGRRNSVHVHSRLHWYTWDPFEFVPSGNLWRRARTINLDDHVKLLIPCAEDCILVLAAHAMVENREVSLSDVFQLDGIVRKFPEVNWLETVDIAFKRGWCFDLVAFLKMVNYVSLSLYGTRIAPETFFSYAEKKIPSEERLFRRLARTTTFSIPWSYPYTQRGLSFVNVFLKNYKSLAVLKIARGFAHRTAYELRRDKGE